MEGKWKLVLRIDKNPKHTLIIFVTTSRQTPMFWIEEKPVLAVVIKEYEIDERKSKFWEKKFIIEKELHNAPVDEGEREDYVLRISPNMSCGSSIAFYPPEFMGYINK